jgi:serine/threonine-protein kinase
MSMSRYKIIRSIFRGRNTEIFHGIIVHPQGLGSQVAIKRLHEEKSHHEPAVRAFLNEARVGIALHHSNVVDVIRASTSGGEPEIIMQYLHGWSLASILSRLRTRQKPLPLEVAVSICHAMASGVAHLHESGLVHGHITPANVMLTTDGCTKVIDFGGAISGKKRPASRYTAPEFFRDSKEIDAQGDVYSIGAILYELTTGHVLFSGEGNPTDKIIRGDYPSPLRGRDDFPGALAAILKRSMCLELGARYQDAETLLESLEDFASDMRFTLSPRVVRNYAQLHLDAPVVIDKKRLQTVVYEVTELDDLTIADIAVTDIADIAATDNIDSDVTIVDLAERRKSGPPPIPDSQLTSLRLATV